MEIRRRFPGRPPQDIMNELILVVDDEPKIVRLARDYFEQSGFRVRVAGDAGTALSIARQEQPDLVVLDLNLPGGDGLDVCRALRRESEVPIIMLTARGEEADRLIGLELGADDYITKPFSPRELVARARAVLRRAQGDVMQTGMIRAGDLEIDLAGHQARRGSEALNLTRIEFNLLVALARHPGQTFSRAQLLDRLHGVAYEGYDRSIDAHIKNLRRKIEPDPGSPRYILTVYGVGYKFTDGREPPAEPARGEQ
jgi:two-component system alkaline phosphatase synthesis response regulator PhoP